MDESSAEETLETEALVASANHTQGDDNGSRVRSRPSRNRYGSIRRCSSSASCCPPANILTIVAMAAVVVVGSGYAFWKAASKGEDSSIAMITSSTKSENSKPSQPPKNDKCHDLAGLAGSETSTQDGQRCTSMRASTAVDILKAQELLLQMDEVCFATAGGDNCTISLNPRRRQQVAMSPDWVFRRDPFFGLWLWPRLKLVLFACPKCGNSRVRTMLNSVSEEIQQNEKVDSMILFKPGGKWAKESDHSLQFTSPKMPGERSRKNAIIFEQNPLAYEYVDELLADPEWTSLGITRHPYERLISGYSEIESRWNRMLAEPGGFAKFGLDFVDQGAFRRQPIDTSQRALAFWSEFVLGQFYDPNSLSQCLLPISEVYHMSPIGAFFLRDSSQCESSSLYTTEHTIDIDELHNDWPKFIKNWESSFNKTMASKFATMATKHSNSKAGSNTSATMKSLLISNDVFRKSVDSFYSRDFTRFGFKKDISVVTSY
mmetsp:Transcript_35316/g.71533  ORF Transcript_35316/g.71533 Transcript_35316/m.71533 type:complete len:489 (-) Transcript_35316:91-1557(-)